MSRKCDHDWFDHYMMYNMMSNGGGKGSGEAFWLLIAGGIGLYLLANVLAALAGSWLSLSRSAQCLCRKCKKHGIPIVKKKK